MIKQWINKKIKSLQYKRNRAGYKWAQQQMASGRSLDFLRAYLRGGVALSMSGEFDRGVKRYINEANNRLVDTGNLRKSVHRRMRPAVAREQDLTDALDSLQGQDEGKILMPVDRLKICLLGDICPDNKRAFNYIKRDNRMIICTLHDDPDVLVLFSGFTKKMEEWNKSTHKEGATTMTYHQFAAMSDKELLKLKRSVRDSEEVSAGKSQVSHIEVDNFNNPHFLQSSYPLNVIIYYKFDTTEPVVGLYYTLKGTAGTWLCVAGPDETGLGKFERVE